MFKITSYTKISALFDKFPFVRAVLSNKFKNLNFLDEKLLPQKVLNLLDLKEISEIVGESFEDFCESLAVSIRKESIEPISIDLEHEKHGEVKKESDYDEYSISGVHLFLMQIDQSDRVKYINSSFAKYLKIDKSAVIGKDKSALLGAEYKRLVEKIVNSNKGKNLIDSFIDENNRHMELKVTWKTGESHIVVEDTTDSYFLKKYIGRYVFSGIEKLDEEALSTFKIPERRFMTVGFTDLRGFTAYTEKMDPADVRVMINSYFDAIISAIDSNNATVDKIIGDEVMALYGAPVYYKDHAFRAIKTSLDQIENLKALQIEMKKQGKKMPDCGIGVNTGEMIVGNIGSETRQDYTVLGSSVNLSARLCGAAQGGQVLMTESTLMDLIDNLPKGWEFSLSNRGVIIDQDKISQQDSKTIFPLQDKLQGLVYEIGPRGKGTVYTFAYLYRLKVKGFNDPVPIIEATYINKDKNLKFSMDDLAQSLSEEVTKGVGEKIFGKYRLLDLIGSGGISDVYRARDPFGNDVAIKMLRAGSDASKELVTAFNMEAKLMKNLDHRSICRIFEAGEYEKISYIAMEYVHGHSLDEVIKKKINKEKGVNSLPEQYSLKLVLDILEAVQYAHEQGIIHRDIKPSNIMIKKNGQPVLMDFGLAVLENKEKGDNLVGTMDFMAPEQSFGVGHEDERADIFSIGAILYYMVAGDKWFKKTADIFNDASRLRDLDVILPRVKNPKISEDLENIILKAMSKEPLRRYPSAKVFADDIKRYLNDEPITARPPSFSYKIGKKLKKNKPIVAAALAVLLVIAVAGGLLYGENLKQLFRWTLVLHEDFEYEADGSSFTANWKMLTANDEKTFVDAGVERERSWYVVAGKLLGRNSGRGIDNLTFTKNIPGNIRVEWEITPKQMNLELNSFIAGRDRTQGYTFHIGAWGNPNYFVLTKGESLEILDYKIVEGLIQVDKTHKFMMEKENNNIRLFINGRKIFDYEDYDELSGHGHQNFGFENSGGNLIIIDNVRVYSQTLPQRISPLAVPNRLYQLGMYRQAYEQYKELMLAYPGRDIAEISLFRMGICKLREGAINDGVDILLSFEEKYPEHYLVPFSIYERSKTIKDESKIIEIYKNLAERHPEHPILRTIFFNLVSDLNKIFDVYADNEKLLFVEIENARNEIIYWADIFDISLSNNAFFDRSANFLRTRGYFDKVIQNYPSQRHQVALTLLHKGDFSTVMEQYSDQRMQHAWALFHTGRVREAFEQYPDQRNFQAQSLLLKGGYDELIRSYSDQRKPYALTLIYTQRERQLLNLFEKDSEVIAAYNFYSGNFRDVIRKHPNERRYVALSHLYLNRPDIVINQFSDMLQEYNYALRLSWLNAVSRRNFREAERLMEKIENTNFDHLPFEGVFANFIIIPFVEYLLLGNKDSVSTDSLFIDIFDNKRDMYAGYLWYCAAFIKGRVSEFEFLSQDVKRGVEASLDLSKAIRYEILGENSFAHFFYKEYLDKELKNKLIDPVAEAFAAWRVRQLARYALRK